MLSQSGKPTARAFAFLEVAGGFVAQERSSKFGNDPIAGKRPLC